VSDPTPSAHSTKLPVVNSHQYQKSPIHNDRNTILTPICKTTHPWPWERVANIKANKQKKIVPVSGCAPLLGLPYLMPYVDLGSKDDYASIWYRTNSPFGNVGGFVPTRPTVIVLHPMFLDSSWLQAQFGDPRLNAEFNLVATDMRVCGKSMARPSGMHDNWVEAADLAFVHRVRRLQLKSIPARQRDRDSPPGCVRRRCIYPLRTFWPWKASRRTVPSDSRPCFPRWFSASPSSTSPRPPSARVLPLPWFCSR
jgi:hypothetical protein